MTTRLLCMLLLTCIACQVGDPLVDEVDGGQGRIRITCNAPPGCMPVERGEAQQLTAIPVRVECEQTCILLTAGGDTASCPPSILERLPSSAHCMNVDLQPPAADLHVHGVDWQDVNIPLHAMRPLTVTLQGGTMQRVYLDLEGPVTLRMTALQQFDDLRIVGRSNAQGSPQIEIAAESGNELSVGSLQALFPGEVRITAGVFENVDLHTETFTAESVIMKGARLHADTITLTDVTLERGLVDTQHALWSAFVATDAALRFCGDARLITGQMARCAITACAGSNVRMYNDSFVSGSLDGDYEMSDTNVENTQIAPLAATRVFAYGTNLTSVNMCEHTQLVVFGTASRIKCSACAEALEQNLPVCAVEEADEKWLQNYCPGWTEATTLPFCSDDTPIRANRAR
ncbi:MAG TPA: hypothetical protein VMF89_11185 [Polyangiales bacterium]|nr:hypothetical protein [Polyangiales bacterium]